MHNLYMIRAFIGTMELFQIARRPHLCNREVDSGYLLHCLLRELFLDDSPHPFAIVNNTNSKIELLGYSNKPAKELKEIAEKNRSRRIFDAVDWARFSSKPLPSKFPDGSEFNFQLRACPVVRKGRGSENFRPGAEVDVFLSEVIKRKDSESISREAVYEKWLRDMFNRYDIEIISNIEIAEMRLTRFVRKNRAKNAKTITRPDVIFRGKIKINNGSTFSERLRKGFGRHNAFGFGMILLSR